MAVAPDPFPPKFLRRDYSQKKEIWASLGYSCPAQRELMGGRYWREFPVTRGRRLHAWYTRVGDFYVRDYGYGQTRARPYYYDWPKP